MSFSPKIRIRVPRLRTAPAARQDIRDIRTFSRTTFGVHATAEYLGGLRAIFDLLEARPMVGGVEQDLGINVRSFGYRSHRIYYRLEGNDLLVIRVLHHARDVAGAFGPGQ